ncbi:hypothetical protein PG991_015213 [Apiospora marii]|uniref:Uncharacterized protein n=1 Tax=Apiospora marii TaxID=335849 RepID=A0ABR1R153_9PEZI
MANLGTLPVPFAPSAACSTEMASVYNEDGAYFLQGRPLSYSPCMPQNYVPSRSYYYSATECPSGYTPACSNFVTVQTLTGTQVNVDWPHESTLVCATNLPSTTWTLPSVTVLLPDSTYVTALSGTNGGINAYGVQLQYDPAAPAPSTSAPGLTTTSGPGPTGSPSSQGLSTGAVAGIGVGCAVAGLAIAAAATSLFFRRRRPPHRDSPPAALATVQEPFMAGQHNTDKAHGAPPDEPFYTDSYSEPQVQEVETRQSVQEIDTTPGQVPEMSG